MKKFNFKKIDAFTREGSNGNPAGCVYLKKASTENDMQKLAYELRGFVNEVVYCLPEEKNDDTLYSLLYYSSECEVEFCGHATIACMYDLISSSPRLIDKKEIIINTKKGELIVYNNIKYDDAVYITAPVPEYIGSNLSESEICKNLNIPEDWIDKEHPIDIINVGLRTLILPIEKVNNIIVISPDINKLKNFCLNCDIDIIIVYSTEVKDNANKLHTRVFAPKFGYLEDPATGSGNSAIGYYILKNNMWDGTPISIEQGPSLDIPNIVKLDTIIAKNGERQVLFGGRATVRIEGSYLLK
ncbi:MAG: PhzF family phenazine biosynthesis protein [Clostridiales bacterium]